jgi:hypothetical protein
MSFSAACEKSVRPSELLYQSGTNSRLKKSNTSIEYLRSVLAITLSPQRRATEIHLGLIVCVRSGLSKDLGRNLQPD